MKLLIPTVVIALWLVSCSAKSDGTPSLKNCRDMLRCDSIYVPKKISMLGEHDSVAFKMFNIVYKTESDIFIDHQNILKIKVASTGSGNRYAIYYDAVNSEIIVTCYRLGWKEDMAIEKVLSIKNLCVDINQILKTNPSNIIIVSTRKNNPQQKFNIKIK